MSAPTYVVSTVLQLAASKITTLILLNPAVVQHRITEIGVSFDGSTAGQGVGVNLYRTSTLGSPAGAAATPIRENAPAGVAAQSTALVNLTTEPTALDLIRSWYVSPFGGLVLEQFPHGREPSAMLNGGRLGLRVVTPASVSPNVTAYIAFEE